MILDGNDSVEVPLDTVVGASPVISFNPRDTLARQVPVIMPILQTERSSRCTELLSPAPCHEVVNVQQDFNAGILNPATQKAFGTPWGLTLLMFKMRIIGSLSEVKEIRDQS